MDRSAETGLNLSRNVDRLMYPTIAAIRQEARKRRAAGEDVLDLAFDEPLIEVSRLIVEAGLRAMQQTKAGSLPDAGVLDLRVAIARHLSLLSGGRPVNADNIIISNGARQ
ncbi:hypothetical protein ACFL3B_02865, partial [Gemmatimonadota bacterium]